MVAPPIWFGQSTTAIVAVSLNDNLVPAIHRFSRFTLDILRRIVEGEAAGPVSNVVQRESSRLGPLTVSSYSVTRGGISMAFAFATPEKRLFVSLITRDITLADAILDLIDNSINAAMHDVANPLNSAKAFHSFLTSSKTKLRATIRVDISPTKISVIDDAGGIQFKHARDGIFHFGAVEQSTRDRLSVFGIGMKRALFKIGNDISIVSDHPDGGFALDLDAGKWETTPQDKWGFEIDARPKSNSPNPGTRINISGLHDDVRKRISDSLFLTSLRDKIAKTYSYFLGRFIKIFLNNRDVSPITFDIGSNFTHESFTKDGVEYDITTGISRASARFTGEFAGWFIYCNGRALLFADKSEQTGWGGEILPVFQPKHRPFLGLVFFYSDSPELLPWTTTKDSINQESSVWQDAKRQMTRLARPVIKLLDDRYSNDGTDFALRDLENVAGAKTSSFAATVSAPRSFMVTKKKKAETVRIQYDAELREMEAIKRHVGKSSLTGTKIGRMTFEYYLRNEVGSK
jgi:hypothetical protein